MPAVALQSPDRTRTHSLKWTQYAEGVIPAWVADTDFQAPEPILAAVRAHVDHGVLGYEMPWRSLRETVAARMAKLYGWEVDPEAVVATPGIVAAFNTAAKALCQPGQGILTQPPVYPPFLHVADNADLVNQYAPLDLEERDRVLTYRCDLAKFKAALHSGGVRTAMFLLCNPHNPTGQIYSRQDLQGMADLCLEQGVPIVSDEIHCELMLDGAKHTPIATLSKDIERASITLVAPSKTYNVPGLFCGFAIVPDPELRKRFTAAADRMAHHVSSLSLTSAEVAYSGACDGWLEAMQARLTANRDWLVQALRERFPLLGTTIPQGTYLDWIDCRRLGLATGTPHAFFLERGRVALNPGEDFGPGGAGFVRLNFGTTPERLQEIVARMEKALTGRAD